LLSAFLDFHFDLIQIGEAYLEHFYRLLSAGEGDEDVAVVLEDMRIIDPATTDEVNHFVKYDSVIA
jgi:hypothetical protein